jgi:hypothetical protein
MILACRIVIGRQRHVHAILEILMDRLDRGSTAGKERIPNVGAPFGNDPHARAFGNLRAVHVHAVERRYVELLERVQTRALVRHAEHRAGTSALDAILAEAFGPFDDRARTRIGRPRLGPFRIRERENAEREQLIDFETVVRVDIGLRRDSRKVAEDDRRRKQQIRALRILQPVADENRPRVAVLERRTR